MKVYQKYATYYDILYQHKNYPKECNFLAKVFNKYVKKKSLSILDLGCGTGSHALILAKQGNKVTGVDLSDRMIKLAKEKAKGTGIKVYFRQGDVRNVSLNKKFDIVLLMFNVIGYQITNQDLVSTFKTASRHLKKGGILIFDCWFGPAVLKQMPGSRKKIIKKDNREKLIKSSTSILDIFNQTIDIRYQVQRVLRGKILEKVNETHKIRFLFPQEIKCYLEEVGFQSLEICPFLQINKKPNFNDWNITVIAKKI
ncbi:MAG: class I SAM-dependent methyltransferase [Candidatus Nealsonbacteria bacterium]